jgi:mannose-6-phosphate isomerase-like protein (cupin superfamily)
VTSPASKATSVPYTWGSGGTGWHLLRSEGLSVIEERMEAGCSEIAHRHAHARQFFYVLRGVLSMEGGGVLSEVPGGSGIEIAPGDVHRAFNVGPDPVEFLVVSAPPSHGDREDVG